MEIAAIVGRIFWKACTHDVTNIACRHERRRQFRYEHEKTKNGQITTNPHAGAKSECITAQINAEMIAGRTCLFDINDSIQSPPPMSNVSKSGLIITNEMSKPGAEPSNSGPVSSVIAPLIPKIIAIIIEGTRLIRPVRRIYFHIEILLSNSRESSRGCLLCSTVVSCWSSRFHLIKCSEKYTISLKNAIIKLIFDGWIEG